MKTFFAQIRNGLSEFFACHFEIIVQPLFEFLPGPFLRQFNFCGYYRLTCFGALRTKFICKPGLIGHFFRTNIFFNFLVPQRSFFSLLFVPPTRLRPQQLVADVMTAAQNKHHSIFMSSVKAGSSSNLDAMLSAHAVCTSLSANDSNWIR